MSDESKLFQDILEELRIDNADEIHKRRDEITKALNQEFRNSESTNNNRYYIGSFGRKTAIKGISDLDLMYILPDSLRDDYSKENGARKALTRVRAAIISRYPKTSVRVNQTVVVVQFQNFKFEIQPVFKKDGAYLRPDSYDDRWKIVNPSAEREAFKRVNTATNGTARHLARLVRAWKLKANASMNGLLIDTFVYRFLEDENSDWITQNLGETVRDFFVFLADQPRQDFFRALGSGQEVKVKENFQGKAKKSAERAQDAIDAKGSTSMRNKWKMIFGKFVPSEDTNSSDNYGSIYDFCDTEEFIEDMFPVEIGNEVSIDCKVIQNGFRPDFLSNIIKAKEWLSLQKTLDFSVISTDVPEPYKVRWKVLNRGDEAYRLDQVRGQIIKGTGKKSHREYSRFRGAHEVECYILKCGVVVARERILVPIGGPKSLNCPYPE